MKLQEYLVKLQIPYIVFANTLGVTNVCVRNWVNGVRVPMKYWKRKIAQVTNDAVPYHVWPVAKARGIAKYSKGRNPFPPMKKKVPKDACLL